MAYLSSERAPAITQNVLLIEQEAALRDLITLILQRVGCTVRSSNNLFEITELLENGWPNIVLVDILTRSFNALNFIQELKNKKGRKNLPIIIISSLAFGEIVQKSLNMGANDFLVKPVNADVLVKKVFHWLGHGVSDKSA